MLGQYRFLKCVIGAILLAACKPTVETSGTSSAASIESIYVKIGPQDTFLKASTADASRLDEGKTKCLIKSGNVVLILEWPADTGTHTLIRLRYPLPNCELKEGYLYIPHIARQDIGTFNPGSGATAPTSGNTGSGGSGSNERRVCKAPSGLNLRAEPNTNAAIVSILEENTIVVLKGETSGAMVKIEVKGNANLNGWLSSEYLCTGLASQAGGLRFPFDRSMNICEEAGGGAGAFGSGRSGGARGHAGCDLYAETGESIRAMEDGTVISAGSYYEGTDIVDVRNDKGGIISYGEVRAGSYARHGVYVGSRVTRGQIIAEVGQLYCCHSMLHLEMYSGAASGSLAARYGGWYQRRSDLIDPTSLLKQARRNLLSGQ